MKFTLQLVFWAFFAGVVLSIDVNLKESEKSFEAEFHKKYANKADEKTAAAALAKTEKQINQHNEKFVEGKSTFYEKLNEFSDMTKKQFEKEKEGAKLPKTREGRGLGAVLPDKSKWYTSPELLELYANRGDLPDSWDASSRGLTTPPRNQMSCGSCAAFAATGVHETCMLMAGARMNGLDLSEQMLIDCGFNGDDMNGCHGASSGSYGKVFAEKLQGQSPHEMNYPYLDTVPKLKCPTGTATYNSGALIKTPLEDFECSEEKLKQQVATYGAVVSYLYASDKSFGNYANGIFSGCSSKIINHAVLVYGYGTENGVDYWLVKNSWGTDWGNGGTIKIKRGTNECGIGNYCYAAQCEKTTEPLSDPPIPPPPAPIPAQQECDVSKIFPGLTGDYNLNVNKRDSEVSCTNGICRARVAGPSNACMYICGKLQC